jgi:hypothetical protein
MSIGGAVTGGTNLSILFINPAGVLAQDNPHFTFDPTTNYLNLGVTGDEGIYYLNNLPGLYQVPNASGNNWFEGNSGNLATTGYSNFGTGDNSLAHVTTGHDNMAVGTSALTNLTSGTFNTAVGSQTLFALTSGSYNFAFGYQALAHSVTGSNNTAIGGNCANSLNTGNGNVSIGTYAMNSVTSSSYTIVIGSSAASNLSTSGGNDIFIGSYAAGNAASSFGLNTFIGDHAGFFLTGMSDTTIIGRWGGPAATLFGAIVLATSDNYPGQWLDWNYTTANTWSFQYSTHPIDLHVYNTTDMNASPTNYERAALSWRATSNVFRLASQAGGTGTMRLIAIDAFSKAGAPAAGDLPSGTCAFIDDTTNNQTWLVFNKAGTIRKVQLT